jgi:hypothetical protein
LSSLDHDQAPVIEIEKTVVTAAPRPPEKLAAGVTIRETAAENGASISTVQRIKAAMISARRVARYRNTLRVSADPVAKTAAHSTPAERPSPAGKFLK